MKKFYSMALALGVAVSAMAAPQVRQIQSDVVKSHTTASVSDGRMTKVSAAKVKSFDGEENSIEGYYNLTLGDYYFEGGANETTIGVNVTLNGTNFVMTSESDYFPADIVGTYDATANTVTFSTTEMGAISVQGQTYYVKFMPFEYVSISDTKGEIRETPVVGTFNASAGTISFPADHGLSWKVYSSSNYSESSFEGYMECWDIISMEKAADPEAGWKVVTEKAKWMDRMVWPMFQQGSAQPTEKEITVQQNEENPKLYRMVGPFADLMGDANIVLDTTDETNVLITLQSSGIITRDMGQAFIASTTEILADASQGNLITKSGNRIDFPVRSVWLYFPTYSSDNVYYNNEQTEPGYLIIEGGSSVEDVSLDANAPVEYFNLHGIPVANPEKGQLVIARQGGKTVKMIAK